DRLHHAVEHAAGGHNVGTRPHVADTLGRQKRQCVVVVQINAQGRIMQQTAMAVVRVFAEALIRKKQDLVAKRAPERSQGLLDDAVVIQGAPTGGVFTFWDAEQDERPQAQLAGFADVIYKTIDTQLKIARHRGNLLADIAARSNEERQNKV